MDLLFLVFFSLLLFRCEENLYFLSIRGELRAGADE